MHSNYPSLSCVHGVPVRQKCVLIGSRCYVQLERLKGLHVLGYMTLRAFIHSCRDHRTEPRHQPLCCPNPFDGFGYPQDFAGSFEQIQFLADTHFAQLLSSCYCHLLFAHLSSLASSHFTANMTLTTNIDTFCA